MRRWPHSYRSTQKQSPRTSEPSKRNASRLIPRHTHPPTQALTGRSCCVCVCVCACVPQPSQLQDALTRLLALEKKTRLAADAISTNKVAIAILDLLHSQHQYALLNTHITLLSKRRAQLQKVQETLVTHAITYLPSLPDTATKRQLIDTLRAVSAGKMFVELERARLTRMVAEQEESEGKVSEAADVMQEVAVETIGTMEEKEKLDFLLEQIRLCLAKRDYVRTEIIAKKIDEKQLKEAEYVEEKLRYYRLMIQYHLHFGEYYPIAQAYHAIYNTPSTQAAADEQRVILKSLVIFALLSGYDSEVSDFIARVKEDKQLAAIPEYKQLLTDYVGDEIITWPLSAAQQKEIMGNDTFSGASAVTATDARMTDVSSGGESKEEAKDGSATSGANEEESLVVHDASQRQRDFHKRIVQHNMRIIAAYYTRIGAARFSSLLQLSVDSAELYLSEMVSSGQLYVRIDRPKGEYVFRREDAAGAGGSSGGGGSGSSEIAELTGNIEQLLKLVETTNHLINKELMTHKAIKV